MVKPDKTITQSVQQALSDNEHCQPKHSIGILEKNNGVAIIDNSPISGGKELLCRLSSCFYGHVYQMKKDAWTKDLTSGQELWIANLIGYYPDNFDAPDEQSLFSRLYGAFNNNCFDNFFSPSSQLKGDIEVEAGSFEEACSGLKHIIARFFAPLRNPWNPVPIGKGIDITARYGDDAFCAAKNKAKRHYLALKNELTDLQQLLKNYQNIPIALPANIKAEILSAVQKSLQQQQEMIKRHEEESRSYILL